PLSSLYSLMPSIVVTFIGRVASAPCPGNPVPIRMIAAAMQQARSRMVAPSFNGHSAVAGAHRIGLASDWELTRVDGLVAEKTAGAPHKGLDAVCNPIGDRDGLLIQRFHSLLELCQSQFQFQAVDVGRRLMLQMLRDAT